MTHHALRDGVGDWPQPAADPRSEKEGLHVPHLPDDPQSTHPRVGLGEHAFETVQFLNPCGIGGNRLGRRTPRFPPSARRALMSESMWRVSPKRYSPVTTPGSAEPY